MGYKVITPLVIAKSEDKSDIYIYIGQPVPANVPESEIKRLLDGGFIESDGPVDDDSVPEGEPSEEWTVKQLRSYAKDFDVDLGKSTSKSDILAALA